MTKRELIEALEALECSDDARVLLCLGVTIKTTTGSLTIEPKSTPTSIYKDVLGRLVFVRASTEENDLEVQQYTLESDNDWNVHDNR